MILCADNQSVDSFHILSLAQAYAWAFIYSEKTNKNAIVPNVGYQ